MVPLLPVTAVNPRLPDSRHSRCGLTFIRLRHKFLSAYDTRPVDKYIVTPVNLNKETRQHLRSDRKCFRVKSEIPCEVGPPGGGMKVALIHDLSCGGVKFSCNQQTIGNIFPDDQAPLGVVLDVFIDIHFSLHEADRSVAAIKTSARVIHTERLAQDLFQVGVQFIDLSQAATRQLENFIEAFRKE